MNEEHSEMNATPDEQPVVNTSPRSNARKNIGKTARHIMSHPILKKGAGQALGASKQFLHQTTTEEKIILVASLVALFSPFFAWIDIENTVVRGIDYFFYGVGYIILLTALVSIVSVLMAIFGKPLPRLFSSHAELHVFMGWQLMMLGIIGFTIIYSIDTLSFSANPISHGPVLVIFCGLAILGAGLFEHATHRKSVHSKILPTMQSPENTSSDTERALFGEDR